jgi:hypothetical protein
MFNPLERTNMATGRPTKLTSDFLTVAESVLFEGRNSFILTDEELIELINLRLPDDMKVAQRTFQDWKAGKTKDSNCDSFRVLLKKALIKQKQDLFTKMEEEKTPAWTKYAWMIERKFDEWNIKQKVDHTTKDKELPTPLLANVKF